MRSFRVLIGILATLTALSFAGVFLVGLLLYQVTPQSILAQQTFLAQIPGLLSGMRLLDRSTNIFYRGPRAPEPLPQYALRIDSQDIRKIEEQLPTELPSPWYGNVFLTEDAKEWVKGKFVADGKEYDVEARVRGDIFNHWAYRKKSWRIKFDGDDLFRGMKEINLIIPEDRGWIAEPLNAYRAKKMGFLQPPMQYVLLSLNGSAPRIYTEVEQWSKEMLEKQAFPGDVNVYGAGGGTSYFQQWDAVFTEPAYWNKYETAAATPFDSFEEIEALTTLGRPGAHTEPQFRERVQALFDTDQLIRWYAIGLLSGSRHVRDHNLRFAFDVSRGRMVPIPWDIGLYVPRTLLSPPGNPFLNEVFALPEWKLATYRMLWNYIQDPNAVQADMDEAQRLRSMVERAAYRDSLKLPSNRTVNRELDWMIDRVRMNFDFLKEELSRSEVLVTQRVPSTQNPVLLSIDLTARGISPAKFFEISVPARLRESFERGDIVLKRDDGDAAHDANDLTVPLKLRDQPDKSGRLVFQTKDDLLALAAPGEAAVGSNEEVLGAPHTRQRFFIVRVRGAASFSTEDLPLNLDIRNAVTGEKTQVIGEATVDDRTFERLPEAYADKSSFLTRNPAFISGPGNEVILRGSQTFNRSVIVPSTVRLRIEPGTTVRMGEDVALLSYAPVQMIGTPTARIRFEPSTQFPWGSLIVVNAKEPSSIEWAEFTGGGETFLNDVYATGMVAFHGSPVTIRDSFFSRSHGDDALNIKYIPADLARLHFTDVGADALDIDVAPSGVLEDSTFLITEGNVGSNGDGVDLSWSNVTLRRLTIKGSRDKCISVGENSKPMIEDVTLERCHYGIATKDGSQATVKRAAFIGNDIAVTAYIKKAIFLQPPSIEIRESTFRGNKTEQEALSGATITIIR